MLKKFIYKNIPIYKIKYPQQNEMKRQKIYTIKKNKS